MIIALMLNTAKKEAEKIGSHVKEYLQKQGVDVVGVEEAAQVDYVISIGGDGTILRIFHRYPQLDDPILGINLGSLGFLADVPLSDIDQALEKLAQGRGHVEERMVLQGQTSKGLVYQAVNDFVFHRGQNPSLIELAIYVEGKYCNTFSADGVIIATPVGSTAYSLAAGGPILTPDLQAIVITPICPHTISNRPIVVGASSKIRIEYKSSLKPVEVSHDGISCHSLEAHEGFEISLSPRKFRLISVNQQDSYATLRTKLGWAGMLKIKS